ncbi:hypothetical protein [Endozoicomonas numazuensis]|uniref:Uncharacterized protein n=1 Tax=Endozoicomonas numazuensis TaxID=1137799 RepID=A0A081NF23_9GAMM|nr:hypothetical protein [Endozoicomonas numazuensis]KEQ17046.1 hypothetical protein GZ78_14175 [Endozoicomonas numazuensis]
MVTRFWLAFLPLFASLSLAALPEPLNQMPVRYELRAYSITPSHWTGSYVDIKTTALSAQTGVPLKKERFEPAPFDPMKSQFKDYWSSNQVHISGCHMLNQGAWNAWDWVKHRGKSDDQFGNGITVNHPENKGAPKDVIYCDNNLLALIENGEVLDTLDLNTHDPDALQERSPAFVTWAVQYPNNLYMARANKAYSVQIENGKQLVFKGALEQRSAELDTFEAVSKRMEVPETGELDLTLYKEKRFDPVVNETNRQTGLSVHINSKRQPYLIFTQYDRFAPFIRGTVKPAIILRMPLDEKTGLFSDSATISPLDPAMDIINTMAVRYDQAKEDDCYHLLCILYDFNLQIFNRIADWHGTFPRAILSGQRSLEGDVGGPTSNSLLSYQNDLEKHLDDNEDRIDCRTHHSHCLTINAPTASGSDYISSNETVTRIHSFSHNPAEPFYYRTGTHEHAKPALKNGKTAYLYSGSIPYERLVRYEKGSRKAQPHVSNDLLGLDYLGRNIHFEAGKARGRTTLPPFQYPDGSLFEYPAGYEIYTSMRSFESTDDGYKEDQARLLLRIPMPDIRTATKNYYDDFSIVPIWQGNYQSTQSTTEDLNRDEL